MAGLAAADDLCPLDGDRRVFGAVCCRADPANTVEDPCAFGADSDDWAFCTPEKTKMVLDGLGSFSNRGVCVDFFAGSVGNNMADVSV